MGPHFTRQCILCQCDNYSLVAAINKGFSKDPLVIQLLRCLWLFVAFYNIDIVAEHIGGATNQVANMLFRKQTDRFLSQYTQVSHLQIPLPPPLLWIVSSQKLKWTSQSFRQCFNNTTYLTGIASTTRTTYTIDQKFYQTFCTHANIPSMPTSESTLLLFVAYLVTLNLSHACIQ